MKPCPMCHFHVLSVSTDWEEGQPKRVEIDHYEQNKLRPTQHVLTAETAAERRNLAGFRADLMAGLISTV